MSEDDVDQNEATRTGSDNDIYVPDFISMMHPYFRSPVPVQSCDQEDMVNSELQERRAPSKCWKSNTRGTY
jgi:hypothetical protein